MKLSQRKYAEYRRERGLRPWSRGAVRLAVEQGTIKVDASGRVDSAQADRAMDGTHPVQVDQERTARATTRTSRGHVPARPPTHAPDGQLAREIWRAGVQDLAVLTYGLLEALVAYACTDVGVGLPEAIAVGRLVRIWLWGEWDGWLGEEIRLPAEPPEVDWEAIARDAGQKYDPAAVEEFWDNLNRRLEELYAEKEGGN